MSSLIIPTTPCTIFSFAFPFISVKAVSREHKAEILLYEKALAELKKTYAKMPNSKQIFEELESLNEKKNTLMQEYSSSKSEMTELYEIRKNYEKYMGKEMER